MLQRMRDNSQSWIAKVIVGVIVLVFALTGWESISRFTSSENKAAEVNDRVITRIELDQAVAQQHRQLQQQIQQMGNDMFDPSMIDEDLLRESVLDDLIDRAVLLDGADQANFHISERMIDQLILTTPDFQVEDQFNADRFDQVIRSMGISSRLAFRDLVREELKISQLRNALEATAFATPSERMQLARLEQQSRDFAVIELPYSREGMSVTDEEVSEYYAANEQQFMAPEQVVLESLTLSRSDFFDQVTVSDADVEDLYQREIGNLGEQRRAAHLLIETDSVDDEDAQARIAQARDRLDAGEDFAAVARDLSDDLGSANDGGNLGVVVRGSFDPAFEEALFALEEGEVSEPVRTSFGLHLIKLTGLQAPEVPSLESMRESLEEEIKAGLVERRFVEASRELSNLAYESADLQEPARALDLEIETHGPVSREGGEGLTANPRVMQAAFEEEVLQDELNSSLIELDDDTAVVVRVKEHQRPSLRPLDDIRDEVEDLLIYRKATEQAHERAEALVAQLRSGELDADAVAAQLDAEWARHEATRRTSNSVPSALLRNIFAMPAPAAEQPAYAQFAQTDGSRWIVVLNGVATPQNLAEEANDPEYRNFVAGQTGEQDFAALRQKLKEDADITRY
ncbi:SurA N-terminal domain-containing protein [Halopseudomonas salegens]|uniref:Periplasmic chaperone PpiD n=1 Tax=Halopseudomonas salegens TaxID=1434072 RepID=A0A1H2EWJ0_9GAMM|nr:SurA N-terminal domain-containing protein [Halopseudomonas salegens]SDT99068.1 peptidyl-prolyl cis-trans isomerase D [Halopseudomonas salegens]